MIRAFIVITAAVTLIGCASAPTSPQAAATPAGAAAVGQSADPSYGYTKENPVKVGGPDFRDGPKRERAFLESLRGPSGERLSYQRTGSCCHFQTPNGFMGGGLLDMYLVTYKGLAEPATIYINFYDPGPSLAPVGFSLGR